MIPYYLYLSSAVSALLPPAAMLVPRLLEPEPNWRVVQLLLVAAAAHLLFVGFMIIRDWRQTIRQLRAICVIQCRKWPRAARVVRPIYRDSATWWRTNAWLVFLPVSLFWPSTRLVSIGFRGATPSSQSLAVAGRDFRSPTPEGFLVKPAVKGRANAAATIAKVDLARGTTGSSAISFETQR